MADDEETLSEERFGRPDPQVERATTSVDELDGHEYAGTEGGSPVDGWTTPPEGHAEPEIDRDDELRREG